MGMVGPLFQQFGSVIQGGNLDGILENFLKSDVCKLEHQHVCDGCNERISGSRFHCKDCPDFDFCSSCFEKKRKDHNEAHNFEEITALSALKEALKNNGVSIDAFFAPGKATDEVQKTVHHAFCDRCDKTIEGIRWKCFECQDFDFCNTCFLESAGKEDVKNHKKDHSFCKIETPQQTFSFGPLKEEFLRKKEDERRNELIQKVQEKTVKEQERLSELEKKKKEIEDKMEEERKKFHALESKLEQERLQLLNQAEEENPVKNLLDLLAPLRESIKEKAAEEKRAAEKKVEEQPKIVYPFEEKLQALESMGFVDRERNVKLLVNFRGELIPVIQELLNDF